MKQCFKVFRHSLKKLILNSNKEKAFYYGLTIDCLWKIMLLNMETLMEHESRVVKETADEAIKNDALLQENYQQEVSRLELREKEMQLEYTIKKEQCDAKVKSLTSDKVRLTEIIEANAMHIQDLMDPSRFMYMHYFLTEFKDKFEGSYESNLTRLKVTQGTLGLMLERDKGKELNDELSTGEMHFPKYTISILRNFQEQLGVTNEELLRRWKKVGKKIKEIRDGVFVEKEMISTYVQTDKLKELEDIDKVNFD
eukprot:TRINITY_DN4083_c0_g2_i1.p1 TRINITY_DN4083_c0_g2~~TRINITY_DN4083_c0_g2_i1.p1  ORF type:complete len:254 (-),score=64.71 TRINITY_DN4083_c0_g2_i1:1348-2109(-)